MQPSILKSTRESKGLTLEIVHEATKIPMDSLKAIEEGYSSRILSPFYYRGFIKIYSEFLGLDVKQMYMEYGLDQPAAKTVPVATAPVKSSRKEVVPNLFLEQSQEWIASIFKPETLKLLARMIGFLILFFVLFRVAGCVVSHLGKKAPAAKKQAVRTIATSMPAVKHEAVVAQSVNNKVEVAVRAIKSTWLRVTTDGNVVFETTLAKGSMETWDADKRIELSGRDIEQLDMEVNGKHIGPLGGGERRIRKVLITAEGLTVKK